MPFPKAVDYHKPNKPLVPNCYGIYYVLTSVCYWFILAFLGIMETKALPLATSVLFGGTMGLFDDMVDLKWRYKAILPVFAALPLMVLKPSDRTTIAMLFFGSINLGSLFFILLIPIFVTVTTNVYNQLGGLNGLEAISGVILLSGLILASKDLILLLVPLLSLIALSYLSYNGKAFIGNVGTFSIGLTLAVYAILMNLKLFLIISLTPFIINSLLILFSRYFLHETAETFMDEKGFLRANKIRSLRTLILHYKPMKEHQAVLVICSIVALFTIVSLLTFWLIG